MAYVEVIRKVFVAGGYMVVRPWPENDKFIELCTEVNDRSAGHFGQVSIAFDKADDLMTLAGVLIEAAKEVARRNAEG